MRNSWRVLPLLLAAALLWPLCRGLTAEKVAAWSPRQAGWAAVFLLGLYVLKGLTMAPPLSVLEAAGGLLFPLPAALAANLCGVAAAQAAPYLLGRRRQDRLEDLAARWPPLEAAGKKSAQPGRTVFLLRLGGVLPGDLVSWYLGAAGVPWRAYFTGGLLGSFPRILSATVLGTALWDIGGQRFWWSLAAGWGLTALSLLLWRRWTSSANHGEIQPESEGD